MKWKEFTLATTTQVMGLVNGVFDDIDIGGIEIEDSVPLTEKETKGMFIDILPELPPDEGVVRISFYLDDDADVAGYFRWVEEGLDELSPFVDLGARTIIASETEDKSRISNRKQHFKPFTADGILIKPTWETIPEEHRDKLLMQIDPGTTLGIGMHEATQPRIRRLKKYMNWDTLVLDVETDSGILGVTTLKLGVEEVWGTNLDENAINTVRENLETSSIPEDRLHVLQGNIIDDISVKEWAGYDKYDVAIANILTDVIILPVDEISVHLRRGNTFTTSDIIDMKEETVKEAFERCLELEMMETTYQGEWVSVIARGEWDE